VHATCYFFNFHKQLLSNQSSSSILQRAKLQSKASAMQAPMTTCVCAGRCECVWYTVDIYIYIVCLHMCMLCMYVVYSWWYCLGALLNLRGSSARRGPSQSFFLPYFSFLAAKFDPARFAHLFAFGRHVPPFQFFGISPSSQNSGRGPRPLHPMFISLAIFASCL
jgi:hypothetical protein